uniref:Melanin concentrating hormone receptor 2b n=2 Tax=Latimeria chalumnae TaxID=7897 RepID=H3B4D5_LATCH
MELFASLISTAVEVSKDVNFSSLSKGNFSNQSLGLYELAPWNSSQVDTRVAQGAGHAISPAISLLLPMVYTLICVSGVLANALVISIVLTSKQKHISDLYILNLGIADLLFLVGMPFIIHQLIQEKGWVFGEFLCRAVTAIDLNNQFTSVVIVTVLCIDRYIAVVYSATASQIRTVRCTSVINASAWVCSLLLSTPAMLYSKVHRENSTEICLIELPVPQSIYWYTLYQSALAFIIPVLIITILYSLTLHHLSKVMKKVQKKSSTRSRKVTRMALAIIITFLICWTPFHVVQLVNLTATPSRTFYYLNQFSICLSYAHSCVNPILIIFFTEFFKEKLSNSRYCRFLLAWQKPKSSCGGPDQLSPETSPESANTALPCRRRPMGIPIQSSTVITTGVSSLEESSTL